MSSEIEAITAEIESVKNGKAFSALSVHEQEYVNGLLKKENLLREQILHTPAPAPGIIRLR